MQNPIFELPNGTTYDLREVVKVSAVFRNTLNGVPSYSFTVHIRGESEYGTMTSWGFSKPEHEKTARLDAQNWQTQIRQALILVNEPKQKTESGGMQKLGG